MAENKSPSSGSNAASNAEVVEKGSARKANEQAESSSRGRLSLPSLWLLWRLLLPLLLLVAFAVAAYWGWQQLTLQQHVDVRQAQQLQQQNQTIAELSQRLQQRQTQDQGVVASMQKQLQSLQRQINSQSKRLLSMSTTSKEDWKLLEARYLLRLANQRLFTERDSVGSIAQLQAADNILRDLDDIALFPIRAAIANNIAALKLAPSIDRDGVYLRLISLADNLKLLPAIKPLASSELTLNEGSSADIEFESLASEVLSEKTLTAASSDHLWSRLKNKFERLFASASDYVRIRHHDAALTVLSPDAQLYVNQNIRLNIEQAQLALMAEKTVIYQHSLSESMRLLHEYYQLNDQIEVFMRELKQLQQLNIRRALPDISSSLTQIDSYIERLHKLQTSIPKQQTAVSVSAGEK